MLLNPWTQTRLSTIEFEEFRLPGGVRNWVSSWYGGDGWGLHRVPPTPPYAPRYQFTVEIVSE